MLRIGVMTSLGNNPREELENVKNFGLNNTQMACWTEAKYTSENATIIKNAMSDFGVEITAIWAGYPIEGAEWNFTKGPATIGIVPAEMREIRTNAIIKGAEFAAELGVRLIITHAGFISEDPSSPDYAVTIDVLKKIATRCKDLGIDFAFETGQETPITLLRTITDIGTGNLGVNFDPANLLMYGKANPVDALDVLGKYVKGVHGKDGDYPTQPNELGEEKPLGEGRVDYPKFIAKLKQYGYSGTITIEREISGDQQIADIKAAISFLEPLC